MFFLVSGILEYAYGVRLDLANQTYYKVLRDEPALKIYLYPDKLVVKRYVVPNFTTQEWQEILELKDADNYTTVIDDSGNAWLVGRGKQPEPGWSTAIIPLRKSLSLAELALKDNNRLLLDVYQQYPPEPCTYYNLSQVGVPTLAFLTGTIGGTAGTIVDWWVGKNKYWSEDVLDYDGWTVYTMKPENITDIELTAYWTQNSITPKSDCSVPYGVNTLSITLNKNTYQWNSSLGPTIAVQNTLPEDPGDYYFVMYEKARVDLNGTTYTITRIYYSRVTIGDGSTPPDNAIARAIWNAVNYVKRGLSSLADKIVAGLKTIANSILDLLPDWLRSIFESSWNIISSFAPGLFNLITDLFRVYPFIFMLISLKYILSGDMEGWINYVFLHVKLVKLFIDLGLKLIELIKP